MSAIFAAHGSCATNIRGAAAATYAIISEPAINAISSYTTTPSASHVPPVAMPPSAAVPLVPGRSPLAPTPPPVSSP
jgi:hypothetical protein